MKTEKEIVNETVSRSLQLYGDALDRSQIITIAYSAAHDALDLAGFSDENVPDSPRPVSNSPRNTGKNGEFGPTELR